MATPTTLPDHPYTHQERARYTNIKCFGSATVDPASLLTATSTSGTITVKGAALGDPVIVSFSLDLQGMVLTGNVSDGDTVTWVLFNSTAGTLNLASGTMRVVVLTANQGVSDGM